MAALPTDDRTVAMVTGAVRGIGAATARWFAQAGAAVVVVDRSAAEIDESVADVRALGGRALGVCCDVADPAQVTAAVDRALASFGHIDVLVNCAGITRDRLLLTMSDEEWDSVLDVNLGGTLRCSLAVGEHMRKRGRGRIVNFSSVAAEGNPGQSNYAAAKAAIAGLTRALAAELGPHGITVNAVAPGFVATAMVDDLVRRLGVDRQEFLGEVAGQAALGRIGSVDDIAGVVAFLASSESGYLTGETVSVRGGRR